MRPVEITQIVPRQGEDEGARVVISISEGVVGPLSKQMKATPGYRKCCGILQKLGFLLEAVGNYLYNGDPLPDELQKLVSDQQDGDDDAAVRSTESVS